jgi:DnaJ-class molecular chaperone
VEPVTIRKKVCETCGGLGHVPNCKCQGGLAFVMGCCPDCHGEGYITLKDPPPKKIVVVKG